MAFKHGSNAELWLAEADLSTYFNSLETSAEVETAESTTFKSDWKRHIVGQAGGTIEAGGLYDPSMDNVRDTLGDAAGSILTAGPAGMESVGDDARLIKVQSTAYSETSPVGGIVAFSWSAIADGPVGFGKVLHPLAARTATGNGTSHTGPIGGTEDGAVAHLHVTAASAGDTLDVIVEHSTNGSDWTTLGTFAQVSAVGAERIEISGTVNRYLRATYTIAGTDPSFTFGVALARL